MRPLESGTWLFGAATLGVLALAATSKLASPSKNGETRSLLYNIATATGVGAITMYLADLADKQQREATVAAAARPPIGEPVTMAFPSRGLPPATLPGADVRSTSRPAATAPPPAPAGATPPPAGVRPTPAPTLANVLRFA